MKNDAPASLLIDRLDKFTKKDVQHVSSGLTFEATSNFYLPGCPKCLKIFYHSPSETSLTFVFITAFTANQIMNGICTCNWTLNQTEPTSGGGFLIMIVI